MSFYNTTSSVRHGYILLTLVVTHKQWLFSNSAAVLMSVQQLADRGQSYVQGGHTIQTRPDQAKFKENQSLGFRVQGQGLQSLSWVWLMSQYCTVWSGLVCVLYPFSHAVGHNIGGYTIICDYNWPCPSILGVHGCNKNVAMLFHRFFLIAQCYQVHFIVRHQFLPLEIASACA